MLENTIKNEVGDLLNKVKSNCFMPNANPTSLADNLECLIEYELSESGQAGCEIISKRRLNFLIRAAEQANG